jgi:hypothetical protein
LTATLIAGCGKKDEPVVQVEKKEVTKDLVKSVAAPTIEQTKAFAEEGFIYGLPLPRRNRLIAGTAHAPFNTTAERRSHARESIDAIRQQSGSGNCAILPPRQTSAGSGSHQHGASALVRPESAGWTAMTAAALGSPPDSARGLATAGRSHDTINRTQSGSDRP